MTREIRDRIATRRVTLVASSLGESDRHTVCSYDDECPRFEKSRARDDDGDGRRRRGADAIEEDASEEWEASKDDGRRRGGRDGGTDDDDDDG